MIALALAAALLPLLGAVFVAAGGRARLAGSALIVGAVGSLAAVVSLTVRVLSRGALQAFGGFVYVDSLGAFFALTIAVVVVLAAFGSAAYLRAEEEAGHFGPLQVRLYFVFCSIFASGMLASVLVGNLGLLWVLIEASTLASVVLVGLEARASSLEAAWKYVIICSLGVTIALVATLFLFYAGSSLHLTSNQRLTWVYLFTHARSLRPDSLRLAFLLAIVGYGTKVGLAPMHTWLPDAHSEAPSPASAMLSGALLNTGMYAVIRFRAIAIRGLGDSYPNDVLLAFGFLTLAVAVTLMIRRGNFKRLFAYSSVEHMGIISIALGFGGMLGTYGALLQVLNHAIGKSVLFLSSGHFVLGYRTRDATRVRGALGALPLAGGVALLAALGVAGSPPFGLFLSELTIVRAGFGGGTPELAGGLLLLLVVGFIALVATVVHMVAGEAPGELVAYPHRTERVLAAVPLLAGLAALLALGVWIPGGLNQILLHAIQSIS